MMQKITAVHMKVSGNAGHSQYILYIYHLLRLLTKKSEQEYVNTEIKGWLKLKNDIKVSFHIVTNHRI